MPQRRSHAISSSTLLALVLAAAAARAQSPDTPEPGSVEAIKAATTEARFITPWVAYVPQKAGIPSPTQHLGHIVGAPGELTNTTKIYAYYRALAAATRRVRVEVIGTSEEGREILLVAVGDEKALDQAEAYRKQMAELADPRKTAEAAAEQIMATVKPSYLLHGGLHSGETGSPEMLMELAHRLAVSEQPYIREIRDKLIVLINPAAEPDGRDRMVDWFYRHLKGKTDFENLPPLSPPYWGKYVRHDNNRDGIQRKLALTRATQDAYLKWLPLVMHDLHESVPLLSIWTGTGPYNPNLDPSVFSEWHTIAFQEVATLTAMGLPGVWTYGFGEGFAQVYQDSPAINHNGISRGYETFGNATAETVERTIDPERNRWTGRAVTEPDWYRMVPPPKKLKWSLRNNTNYMETGVLTALQFAARNSSEMLAQLLAARGERGQEGRDREALCDRHPREAGRPAPPRAAREPAARARDRGARARRRLSRSRKATTPPARIVVRLDQPYRGFALDLLTPQKYPADKAPYDAYDDVAWSLPVALGIETKAIEDETVRGVKLSPVAERVAYKGSVGGDAGVYLIRDSGQEGLLAARVRLAGFKVEAAEKPFSAGGKDYPAGSWIVTGQAGLRSALESVAADLVIDVDSRGERARREAPPRRPAAPRGAAGLERHAVGRLGAHDLRRREDPVHADHGRGRAQGRRCASAST